MPWGELSDSQLRDELQASCGRAFIGFKEAGAVRGVDPQGRNLTSAETVTRMQALLAKRGVIFEFIFDLPAVAVRMPTDAALVTELRHHPNVDYLEPIFPGLRLAK